MTEYATLCSFSVAHEYFGSAKPGITLTVGKATNEVLGSTRLLFRADGNNATLLCEMSEARGTASERKSNTALKALVVSNPDATIEINLESTDPLHPNYTAPAVGENQPLAFPLLVTVTPGDVQLNPVTRIWGNIEEPVSLNSESAETYYATPVYDYQTDPDQSQEKSTLEYWDYFTQAVTRPLGVIRLPLSSLLKHLETRKKPADAINISATFSSRKVFWRYNILSLKEKLNSDFTIADRAGVVNFERLPDRTIHNDIDAACFISDRPMALTQRVLHQFELQGQTRGGVRVKEVRELLPAANAGSLRKITDKERALLPAGNTEHSTTTLVADIYVN